MQKDVFRLMRSGKDARQKNPIVISMGLVSEHNDVEAFPTVAHNEFFGEASPRHAIPDDYQSLLGCHYPIAGPFELKAIQALDVAEFAVLPLWIDLLHGCQALHEAVITGQRELGMDPVFNARIVEISQRSASGCRSA